MVTVLLRGIKNYETHSTGQTRPNDLVIRTSISSQNEHSSIASDFANPFAGKKKKL